MSESTNPGTHIQPDRIQPRMPEFRDLPSCVRWIRLCGILSIAAGVCAVIFGFLPFLTSSETIVFTIVGGIIIGSVIIISGFALVESSKKMKLYQYSKKLSALESAFQKTNLHFKISGILVMIGIFFIVLVFIVFLLVIALQGV
ncbi:MAG: hypothetical protein JW904_00885 [Spirochaetales bacterium]|nr:hypothetical protein [Spirochaetales bacterium]